MRNKRGDFTRTTAESPPTRYVMEMRPGNLDRINRFKRIGADSPAFTVIFLILLILSKRLPAFSQSPPCETQMNSFPRSQTPFANALVREIARGSLFRGSPDNLLSGCLDRNFGRGTRSHRKRTHLEGRFLCAKASPRSPGQHRHACRCPGYPSNLSVPPSLRVKLPLPVPHVPPV
jgi:hypothetical protein